MIAHIFIGSQVEMQPHRLSVFVAKKRLDVTLKMRASSLGKLTVEFSYSLSPPVNKGARSAQSGFQDLRPEIDRSRAVRIPAGPHRRAPRCNKSGAPTKSKQFFLLAGPSLSPLRGRPGWWIDGKSRRRASS